MSKITPFKPWESVCPDGVESRYLRTGESLMMHPATLHLSHSAYRVLDYMRLASCGNETFVFPCSQYTKIVSTACFYKAVRDLEQAGFIEVVARGVMRKPNVYKFSDAWKGNQQESGERDHHEG